MNQRFSLSQRGIVHLLAIVIGLGLLAVLAFSLNALFASRSQQQPQVARQAEVGKQPGTDSGVVEEPSSTPTVAPDIIDPTEGWEIYTNPKYGFSMKYPPDWTLAKSQERWAQIISPGGFKVEVSMLDKPIELTLSKWIENKEKTLPPGEFGVVSLERSSVEISGVAGIKEEKRLAKGRWNMTVYLSKGETIYSIFAMDTTTGAPPTSAISETLDSIINSVSISSFR